MNKKRKIIISIAAVILVIVCLIPVKKAPKTVKGEIFAREEGTEGTVIYAAVLYKIVIWNDMYLEKLTDSTFVSRTGADFYIFPLNFGEKKWTPR